MKSIKVVLVAVAAALTVFITGCDTNETMLVAAANTAGNLGLSAWFAIDAPDDNVKTVLKEVVTITSEASSSIVDGSSYVDTLTPVVQDMVAKNSKLNAAQKNLINTGSSVILSGLDTFISSNDKVKGNTELIQKVVSSFCKGCLTAISRSDDSASAQALMKAHKIIKMQYNVKARAFTAM